MNIFFVNLVYPLELSQNNLYDHCEVNIFFMQYKLDPRQERFNFLSRRILEGKCVLSSTMSISYRALILLSCL